VAQAAEILTRRWTPLVIRELLCGSVRFNDIHRGVPRMSRSLLTKRLIELEEAGVLERRLVGDSDHPEYHLTEAGEKLRPVIVKLGFWGKRWVRREVTPDELDAGLLMWDIQRRMVTENLPDRRVVVQFCFPDASDEHRDFWIVLDEDEIDLCLKDPGFEEDLYIRSTVRMMTDIWLGEKNILEAQSDDSFWIGGPKELRLAFPSWLGLSLFASDEPGAAAIPGHSSEENSADRMRSAAGE